MDCKDHYATQEIFTLMQCTACQFIFTQDHPAEDAMGRYYDTPDYVSHSDTKKGIVNSIYHLARSFMLKQKYTMIQQESRVKQGAILDIGCGTGYFLETMQKHGWQTQGVEVNDHAREAASKRLSHEVASSLKEIENRRFDIISLWHVMEHLHDLPFTFSKLRELLTDEGLLVVALPNAEAYDAAHYQNDWGAYDPPRHVWHFSADTFSRLAQKQGFRIEKIAPMPLDAFYVSMLSEKYQQHRMPFIKGMLQGAKAFGASWGKPKKSSSIIYLLRKI